MRNIPIPVDTTRLTFICVAAPRPRVLNQETGEIKTDRNGVTVYQVGLTATDEDGRVELLTVGTSGEPEVSVGQVVEVDRLLGYVWEQERGGKTRWGVAYRAASITPASPSALSAA
ncbi:MAG: hypothetical protein GEV03_24655 [Streptosporangiales bacterium]|nr:hypothetical protein [Streptosporangiales bacterium]